MTTHSGHRNPVEPGSLVRIVWYDEIVRTADLDESDGWKPPGVVAYTRGSLINEESNLGKGLSIPFGTKGLLVAAGKVFKWACDSQYWYQVYYQDRLVWVYSGDTVLEKRAKK